MFSFTPFLDNTINKPIYYQLYECIKKEIVYGNIKGDEKLPSLRNLSKNLQLSKNTIEAAYDQLYAEGYIKRIPKVGYIVENIDSDLLKSAHVSNSLSFKNEAAGNIKKLKYDLAPQYMDKDCYSIKTWKNIINSVSLSIHYGHS